MNWQNSPPFLGTVVSITAFLSLWVAAAFISPLTCSVFTCSLVVFLGVLGFTSFLWTLFFLLHRWLDPEKIPIRHAWRAVKASVLLASLAFLTFVGMRMGWWHAWIGVGSFSIVLAIQLGGRWRGHSKITSS